MESYQPSDDYQNQKPASVPRVAMVDDASPRYCNSEPNDAQTTNPSLQWLKFIVSFVLTSLSVFFPHLSRPLKIGHSDFFREVPERRSQPESFVLVQFIDTRGKRASIHQQRATLVGFIVLFFRISTELFIEFGARSSRTNSK